MARLRDARRPGIARAAVAAAFAAIAAAVALLLRRVKPPGTAAAPDREAWRCECGQEYEVTGAGRHRIFRLDGEPVLGDACAACERPLGQERRVAVSA